MEFTARQIADFLQGEIEGDPEMRVNDFAKIEEGTAGTLSFLANLKYAHYIYETAASIVLVNSDFTPEKPVLPTLIRVENAYESLAKLLTMVDEFQKQKKAEISPLAFISSTVKISQNAYIEPFVYIGENVTIGKNVKIFANTSIAEGVKIGDNVTLYYGVKIYANCQIGNRCILHAGAVVGADGFGFAPTEDGSYKKIPQMGNVILEDDVEIGANTAVDSATMGSTIVRKGVKLDNLVQIAHNVEVGENTVIASQSGVAGSTKVGKQCVFAGQVGVAGHLMIANGTILAAQTGVPNSIKIEKEVFQGYPAIPVGKFRRSSVVYKNLPELQQKVFQLEKRILELELKTVS